MAPCALARRRRGRRANDGAGAAAFASSLKRGARTAERASMSGVPSISASGLGLLESADRRLQRSAATFTRSAEPAEDSSAAARPAALSEVVDAAVGVTYGRTAARIGVALIEVGRDTEQALLDVLA
jgi:hypothetical protein